MTTAPSAGAEARELVHDVERDLAAHERADRAQGGRRRGRAAALLDDVVVELVGAAVCPLLAVEAAGLAGHVQRAYPRERREVAHGDVGHAVLEAGRVDPPLD